MGLLFGFLASAFFSEIGMPGLEAPGIGFAGMLLPGLPGTVFDGLDCPLRLLPTSLGLLFNFLSYGLLLH